MTIKSIAKTCMAVAESLGLKNSQRTHFATLIMSECMFGNSPLEFEHMVAKPTTVAAEPTVSTIETKRKRRKEETVVEAKKASEGAKQMRLLCRADTKCYCDACKKPIYQVVNDVYDGLKAEEFASKFMPIGHGKLLPSSFKLRVIDGCVMTDCPVCKGDMTLVLWGKKPEKDFEDGDVGSVGGV